MTFKRIGEKTYKCDQCGIVVKTSTLPIMHRCADAPNKTVRWPGPGGFLSDLISTIVANSSLTGCGCRSWINKMNRWGPDGCREHIEEIIDRLVQQAEKHNWKLRVPGIGSLARHSPETIQRWTVKQLILLAIRRAEKASANLIGKE